MFTLKLIAQIVVLVGVAVQLVLHYFYPNDFVSFRPFIWVLQTIAILITLTIIIKERKKSLEQIKRLQNIERKIHNFSVLVEITTTANWKEGQPPKSSHSVGGSEATYVKFDHITADSTKAINCCMDASSSHRDKHDPKFLISKYKASVRSGGWPLGATVDDLINYDHMVLNISSVSPNMINDSVVVVKNWSIQLFVNGQHKLTLHGSPDEVVDVPPVGEGFKLNFEEDIQNMFNMAATS